jgi:RNA polymerase sigma-70 factor (ECF subfamily)
LLRPPEIVFVVAKLTVNIERALLGRLANGDGHAFDELFHAHWDYVFSSALLLMKSRELANDIAQDTFLALWKNRHTAADIENLKGYLRTHVKFLVYKRFRRMKVEDAYNMYLRYKSTISGSAAEQEEYVELKQLQSSLEQGISQLPPQQRRAFKLSREEGLTHEQISEIMGVSKKTVKDYIVRSIAFLRPYMKRYSGLILLIICESN